MEIHTCLYRSCYPDLTWDFCLFVFIVTVQPERAKTQCEHHRDSVRTSSPEGYPTVGAYVPQCDDNGLYRPLQVNYILLQVKYHMSNLAFKASSLQCHGSSGYCWCVDSSGEEREGTRVEPGSPTVDCDNLGEEYC